MDSLPLLISCGWNAWSGAEGGIDIVPRLGVAIIIEETYFRLPVCRFRSSRNSREAFDGAQPLHLSVTREDLVAREHYCHSSPLKQNNPGRRSVGDRRPSGLLRELVAGVVEF
ncbi:hypothetical protein TNCV_831131 [Trichonephila clavipes]|nr:hypothetical protein TNCV_831131 [Trichonephila clavipes]